MINYFKEDASYKNIQVATLHAKKNNLKIKYLNITPEKFDQQNKFDIILNLEVVEHVENLDLYLSSCFKLLKKKELCLQQQLIELLHLI